MVSFSQRKPSGCTWAESHVRAINTARWRGCQMRSRNSWGSPVLPLPGLGSCQTRCLACSCCFLSVSFTPKLPLAPGPLQPPYRAIIVPPISKLPSLFWEYRRKREKLASTEGDSFLPGKLQETWLFIALRDNILQMSVQAGATGS